MGSRLLNYLTTKRGRRLMSNLIAVGSVGLASLHVFPHATFLEKYREFYHMYRSGEEVPLPPNVSQRARQALADCKLPDHHAEVFSFFTAVTFDVLHGGSTALSNGAIVGLPITFSYDTVDDFKKEDLLVNLEQFDFQTAVGRDLLNSLILSEKAQKFAIAREIHACRTPYPYVFGSFALLGTLLSYSLASAMNTKFDLFRLPRTIRVIMYVLTSAIGLTSYCMVKDATNYYYDKVADESACKMGKDYILGGIEFYEKIMARNVALRSALGEKGKKLYTSFGNEEVFLRTPKMPLSAHLDLVKEKLKEIENNEVSATPSS